MQPPGTHGGLGPHMQNNANVQVGLFTHSILTNSNNAYGRVGLHSNSGYKVSEQRKQRCAQRVVFRVSASLSVASAGQTKEGDNTGRNNYLSIRISCNK